MRSRLFHSRVTVALLLCLALLLPMHSTAFSSGVGGIQTTADGDISDVAKEGCLCHNGASSNSVTILADLVPYQWVAGQTYTFHIQLIGGPSAGGSNTGGFSMRASAGEMTGGEGYEDKTQNWNDDSLTMTHTGSGNNEDDRSWLISWTAPEAGAGNVFFWITGNSVNGDGAPGPDDNWNLLTFSIPENPTSEDDGMLRMLFAGDGDIVPPEPDDGHIDLHEMGAPFRAHWLGLLGFNAVIMVILFCGIMLRYGFSTSYEGRSNLLKLRYKTMRRGDQ